MPDIFTDGKFLELPSVSIDTDCSEWFPVFEACLEYVWQRGLIVGDETDVETAVSEALNWLVDNDCIDP